MSEQEPTETAFTLATHGLCLDGPLIGEEFHISHRPERIGYKDGFYELKARRPGTDIFIYQYSETTSQLPKK